MTRSVISHGEQSLSLNRLDSDGRLSSFTDDVKIGVIKFDNGSRIIAFSASAQAMSVYGGDVGLDEFAKHPNARLLWETAQARVTWNYDLAIWFSQDGEDTLFNEFAQEARRACMSAPGSGRLASQEARRGPAFTIGDLQFTSSAAAGNLPSAICHVPFSSGPGPRSEPCLVEPHPSGEPPAPTLNPLVNPKSQIVNPTPPWNIYFRVTLPDAIRSGLVDRINRARGTNITAEQFLRDSRARARSEEIFEQSYMCNPLGAASNHIVEWSAIERCRADYEIERVHLEAEEIGRRFGQFSRHRTERREDEIGEYLKRTFKWLFRRDDRDSPISKQARFRLGFDVAASGQGDLATNLRG